jgi:hypothetical protein
MNWQMSRKNQSEFCEKRGMETLEPLFNQFPFQVKQALNQYGILNVLSPIATNCQRCGSLIPRARSSQCPFCSNVTDAEPKDNRLEPLTILKLRLAKGEITATQYEELKKIIENS